MNIEPEVVACMEDMLNIVVKKERKRIANKKYNQKNREKIAQKYKQYYQENKEQLSQHNKQYRQKNKEQIKEYKKEYNQTPQAIKSCRLNNWKQRGVICNDFEALYDHYIKTSYCDACRVQLTYDKKTTATTKCLDHDHAITDRPNFRNILCHICNVKRK